MSQRRQRPYRRLDRAERAAIERGLDKNRPARAMARDLGRSQSSVADEVRRNRTVTRGPGKGSRVEFGARGRLRQAPRLAARLQRLQQAPLPLLDAVPLRVLRGPRPAAGRRRAVRRQARGETGTGGGVRVHRRQDQGRPGPRPVAGADSRRPLVRVQGRPLHHLPLDRAGLRRHVQTSRTCAARWGTGRGGGRRPRRRRTARSAPSRRSRRSRRASARPPARWTR